MSDTCKSCGASIRWVETENGQRMPVRASEPKGPRDADVHQPLRYLPKRCPTPEDPMNPKEIATEIEKSPVLLAAFREIQSHLPPPIPPWVCPFWLVKSRTLGVGLLLKPQTSAQLALVDFPDGVVFFADSTEEALEGARAWLKERRIEMSRRSLLRYFPGDLMLGSEIEGPPPGNWIIGRIGQEQPRP